MSRKWDIFDDEMMISKALLSSLFLSLLFLMPEKQKRLRITSWFLSPLLSNEEMNLSHVLRRFGFLRDHIVPIVLNISSPIIYTWMTFFSKVKMSMINS